MYQMGDFRNAGGLCSLSNVGEVPSSSKRIDIRALKTCIWLSILEHTLKAVADELHQTCPCRTRENYPAIWRELASAPSPETLLKDVLPRLRAARLEDLEGLNAFGGSQMFPQGLIKT